MTCDLARPEGVPRDIGAQLCGLRGVFRCVDHVEQLLEDALFWHVAQLLNEHCVRDGVVGYHYTRGFRWSFEQSGLLPQTGQQRRSQFLVQHGYLFTPAQRQRLLNGWAAYFSEKQDNARDGRIWFALTDAALKGSGATPLLAYYGGEMISMPFTDDPEISGILRSIGAPLLVRCRLSTATLNTFTDIPWGKVWLSTLQRATNPHAHQYDIDAYCERPVPAADLVEIRMVPDPP